MTALATQLRQVYSIHGVNLEVLADQPGIRSALDLRLHACARSVDAAQPWLSIEFVSSTVVASAPPGLGRSVYETPHGALRYLPEHDLLTGELGGVAVRCESGSGRALITAPTFDGRSLYFATHPITTVVLMELMERLGRFSLHAGCLSGPDGQGIVLAGPSGAGKSTLSLALARSGLDFLGDDVVFLMPGEDGAVDVRALGFADAIGIGAFTAARFSEFEQLAAQPPTPGFPKRLHRFEELFKRPAAAHCIPRVIVFPEIDSDRPSAIAELDRGEALVRLVPDVLVTHEASTRAHIATIADLLRQVSCYRLRSGHDLERAADLVRALL